MLSQAEKSRKEELEEEITTGGYLFAMAGYDIITGFDGKHIVPQIDKLVDNIQGKINEWKALKQREAMA